MSRIIELDGYDLFEDARKWLEAAPIGYVHQFKPTCIPYIKTTEYGWRECDDQGAPLAHGGRKVTCHLVNDSVWLLMVFSDATVRLYID